MKKARLGNKERTSKAVKGQGAKANIVETGKTKFKAKKSSQKNATTKKKKVAASGVENEDVGRVEL